jgi:adenylate cyclase
VSKSRGLLVIARNSTFTYKGRNVDLKQVGRELGVRYVLEGSVRKIGNRVRVTAQLIEVSSGGHLWADRYDRDLLDIFAVQDEITANVSVAILPSVERSERERAASKPPDRLDAWECYHRGLLHYARLDVQENERAREFFGRAIELDPGFAAAHSAMAAIYFTEATTFKPVSQRPTLLPKAVEFAHRCMMLDDTDATGHCALAYTLVLMGCHEEAIAEAEIAVALDRNSAWAGGAHGYALAFGGFPTAGIQSLRTALRLSPFDPLLARWQHHMARAYYFARDYEAATSLARRTCRSYPSFVRCAAR